MKIGGYMNHIIRIQCGNGNSYIVEGKNGSILVDTGKMEHRKRVLEACKDKSIRLLVLTHTHIDHCQNAKYLSEQLDIPIAIHKKDEILINDYLNQRLEANTLLGKIVLAASVELFKKGEIPLFQPTFYLEEGDSLEAYGVDAKIIDLSGHTDGSIGIDVEGDGVIVGDALMNMFYPTASMLWHNNEQMLKSAKKIEKLGERMIYFGHGKPVKNKKWV